MARSHQRGTVRLEHNSWVGFINVKVLDPTTGETKWKKQRVGVLGAKSKMTKHHAQDSLEQILAEKTRGTTEPWDQLRMVLASVPLRDRILLTLDMTETFRPSELFALRWRDFDMDARTLAVRQTAYRGKLRDYGKTRKSLRTVHVPEGLANELWLWKQECPDSAPDSFLFPNARKRNGAERNGPIRTDNYRTRVLKPLAQRLGLVKLNFQVLRRTIATLAQTKGSVKDVQRILGHTKADTTVNVYMQPIEAGVKLTQEAIYAELKAPVETAGSVVKGKNLVRFGTVGVLG